nr:hypothetical protein CFP56_09637 [Quercus suber]
MGQIGINPNLMPEGMPSVGKDIPSQLILFHQGSLPGALAIVMLLPATESAIVILTNTLALNDVPDWVGQLVLEELLNVPKNERNDYVAAARVSASENLEWYPRLSKQLSDTQQKGTLPRRLDDCIGMYWDAAHVFKIVVDADGKSLYWAFQGLESEKFRLTHYEHDTFTWLQPRNELSRPRRWVGTDQGLLYWKIQFHMDPSGEVVRLSWVHDTGVPAVDYWKEAPGHAERLPSVL